MSPQADPVFVDGPDRLVRVDLGVYTLDALLRTAYRISGRAFVHLQRDAAEVVLVRMRPRKPGYDPDTLIREFLNEVLDQRLRAIVGAETAKTHDLIMAHALSRTNLVRPELEESDPKTDPLNVSRPDRPASV
jgi:His-Xaa-Ser system protein HxsD